MFLLQVLSGRMAGKTFRVSGRAATVGRSEPSDIQLPDPAVSSVHLKISARDEGWVVRDLWSGEGTLLNGKALVPGQESFVKESDRLTIGITSFCLAARSSAAATAIGDSSVAADPEQMIDFKTRALQEVENRLHRNEIRYKAVFDNTKSGVMVLRETEEGGDFRVLELNEAALRIEGVREKEQLPGDLASRAFPFAGSSGLMKVIHRVRRSGNAESVVITVPGDKDSPSYRDCCLYPLSTGEVLMLYEDITEKRMREKEQKELQVRRYNSHKLEFLGLMAGGVAHNFRNILQAIYGNAEFLEMVYGDQPEIKKIAGSIAESVEQGAALIEDLLHFSKHSRDADFNGHVDLNEVIEKTCNITSRLLDQKITLEMRLEPGMNVKGNAALLSQVFMNLVSNAMDAINGEGRILVDAAVVKDQVVCRVSDTGMGMIPETVERVFDPFFSLKQVGRGTGLGLSTSRGIIEQHGGSITAVSTPGEGSTFEIRLPFEEAGEVADKRPISLLVPGKIRS